MVQDRRASWTRRLDGVYECLLYIYVLVTMTTPYTPFIQINPLTIPPAPAPATRGRGAKRGRKPRGAVLSSGLPSHQAAGSPAVSAPAAQFTPVQWTNLTMPAVGSVTPLPVTATVPASGTPGQPVAVGAGDVTMDSGDEAGPSTSTTLLPGAATSTIAATGAAAGASAGVPKLGAGGGDEDGEGEDELLPAMADDDYSAQLSWQSESKDNLKRVSPLVARALF